MTAGEATTGKHVPVLDGIRGLAIALVMFHHFFHGVDRGPALADKALFGLAYRGWIGVDLFFVLSGYLITGILYDAKGRPGYFKNFYARRVVRIFPAYYFTLLVFFVLLPNLEFGREYVAGSHQDEVWYWTYLTNFRIAWRGAWYEHHIPNLFWSLAIEEQFYMVWPLVVLAFGRRTLMILCLSLFAGALAVRVALALPDDIPWVVGFVVTPARMDGLAIGAFLALLARGPQGLLPFARWGWVLATAGALPVLYLESQHGPSWEEDPIQTFRFTGYALLFAVLLAATVRAPRGSLLERAFASSPMRFLGKYSYALYLWHGPVGQWALRLYDPDGHALVLGSKVPGALLHSLIAGVLSVAAALASWYLVEKHFLKLKKYFH